MLSDLEGHSAWMKDAERIVFTTDLQRGTGTRMEVVTVVGPFRTNDILEVTDWVEGSHIDVVHTGVVTGHGRLGLATAEDGGTVVSWSEEIRFPWWLGGAITGILARPFLEHIWRGNLRRLETAVSGL